jgi:hypothetical protein
MNIKKERERLRLATGPAAMEPKVIRFRGDPSPCPGDTFVLRPAADDPGADYGVEWAVVERDGDDPRRLRVVPVDGYPQIGSHDVDVQLDEPGRVANIRCDLAAWLQASQLRSERRTGTLPPEGLERVRRKRDAIAAGDVTASLVEEDVDVDPEYRRWKDETLKGALAELKETAKAKDERRTSPVVSRLLALAASVMLVVSMWSLREMRQLGGQLLIEEQEADETIASLRRDHQDLETTSSQRAERHEEEVAELRSDLGTTQQKLRAAQSDFSRANVPYSVLSYDTERNPVQRRGKLRLVEQTLELRRDASHVFLVLEVVEAEPYDRYELKILDDTSLDLRWTNDQLVRAGSVVTLSLPASVLDLRRYRLVLSGIYDGEEPVTLQEGFMLTVLEAYDG